MTRSNEEGRQPLAGRVAIVTGGGSGIGRGEALQLARAGARIVVNDLRADAARKVVDEIAARGGTAVANADSVTTLGGGEAIIDTAIGAFGGLDILVNNAGVGHRVGIGEMTEKSWDLVTAVNLKGCFTTIRHAAPIFRRQQRGVIINTSSEAGLGANYLSSYSAAKEGVAGFTRAVAFELAPFNVRCNAIRPRAFDTGLTNAAQYEKYMGFEASFGRPAVGTHPMAHTIFPKSEEVGAIVAWLCTDDAAAVTGRCFIVGGGEIALMSDPEIDRSCFNPDGWTLESLPRVKEYMFGNLQNPATSFSAEARAALDAGLGPKRG